MQKPRKTMVALTLDARDVEALRAMAQANEGNLSQTVRYMIREVAAQRGITTPAQAPGQVQRVR